MVDICSTLGEKATSFNVSTADIIQFAAGKSSVPNSDLPLFGVEQQLRQYAMQQSE
jgi:peroxidase